MSQLYLININKKSYINKIWDNYLEYYLRIDDDDIREIN